jgi:AraC family transcriptional regulator
MNPVARTLWFIESHYARDVSLEEISAVAGVSRFHLSRVFGMATGHSVMSYLRGRRLTQAARRLAAGAPDILALALDLGYGSHEAFTRAFREHFGLTPEAVRAQGHLHGIELLEAIDMQPSPNVTLASPRFETAPVRLIAGLTQRLSSHDRGAIPALWQRFQPLIGRVPGQSGGVAYGVIYNSDDEGNMDYLCGVEVSGFSALPAELARLRIPEQSYAIFPHAGHVSGIHGTWIAIMNEWLPKSGHRADDAPFLERYDESFDGRTGLGGMELWIPVKAR